MEDTLSEACSNRIAERDHVKKELISIPKRPLLHESDKEGITEVLHPETYTHNSPLPEDKFPVVQNDGDKDCCEIQVMCDPRDYCKDAGFISDSKKHKVPRFETRNASIFQNDNEGSDNSHLSSSHAESDHDGPGEKDQSLNRSNNVFSDAEEGGSSASEGEEAEELAEDVTCIWGDISNTSPLEIPDYTEDEKLLVQPESPEPPDLFRLFLTDQIVSLIVQETNRYAKQAIEQKKVAQPHARLNEWKNVTAEEIRTFIGILIVMGLNQQPTYKHYWSTKSKIYGNILIKESMTGGRFQAILANIHFVDNETADTSDPLFKLRELFNLVNLRFREVLKPNADLVVDESMRKWRGRPRFRIYHPSKASKYCIKLYKLTTLDSYVLTFKVCSGAENPEELVPSQQAILDLCEPYLDEGRTIFADKFYSTIPLVETLAKRSTMYCGTVRKNRKGLPAGVIDAKIKKGEATGQQCQHGTKVINWKDKRNVFMLTSVGTHDVELQPPKRRGSNPKPLSVLRYNDSKMGVDVSDQMGSYHDFDRRGLKWYRKLALDILCNTLVVNAWSLQKHVRNRPKGIVQFREEIALDLLKTPQVETVPRKRRHSLVEAEGTISAKGRRCKNCYKDTRTDGNSRKAATSTVKKVLTYCDSCDGNPYMCLACFNRCHR